MAWATEKPILSQLRRPEVHHQARGVGSFGRLLWRTHPRRLAALADAGDPGLVDASLPHLPPPPGACVPASLFLRTPGALPLGPTLPQQDLTFVTSAEATFPNKLTF